MGRFHTAALRKRREFKAHTHTHTVCVCVRVSVCVYLAVQLLHGDQVQGLEGVARGGDEVQADVDARVVVVEERSLDLQLLLQIVLELGVDVVHDGLVAVCEKQALGRSKCER